MPSASPPPAHFLDLRLLASARCWTVCGAARLAFALTLLFGLALSTAWSAGWSESFADSSEEASSVDERPCPDDADDQDDERWSLTSVRPSRCSRDSIRLRTFSIQLPAPFSSHVSLHVLFCCWLA
jgi:hypothetical protein